MVAGCGALVILIAIALFLSSARHRRFYFGRGEERGGADVAAPREPARAATIDRVHAVTPAVGPKPAMAATTPSASSVAHGPELSPPDVRATRPRTPSPDADGRIRVPITDDIPALLPESGPPAGWELKELAGQAMIALVRDEERVALQVRTDRASFVLYRDVVVDLRQQPMLEWQWKAARLPVGGDARSPAADDQAAQIYVVVPRWPFPRVNSHVVGYLWDSSAPVGMRIVRPDAPNVRSIVVESGPERVGAWIRERRNVHADYVELFGQKPGRVGMVGIMSDTNHTGGPAEAFLDDLVFFGRSAGNAGFSNLYAKIPAILRGNHEP